MKHKYADVICAWANGEEIQQRKIGMIMLKKIGRLHSVRGIMNGALNPK